MPFGSSQWMYNSGADFYNGVATQSLRFDDGSSAYLTRTPSAGDRGTWTWSAWIKMSNISILEGLFGAGTASNNWTNILFNNDVLIFKAEDSGTVRADVQTEALFRDPSAWYHIVVILDVTEVSSSDRVKIYVNGTLQSLTTNTAPSATSGHYKINANIGHSVGARYLASPTSFFDGYMAEVNFVDGTAIGDSDDDGYLDEFGELKNGVWIPKAYTGSYGTNGFRLQFNQTGTGTGSTTTIGADTSGNLNHWDSSGIDAEDCDMPDSPENNFATICPLSSVAGTFSEGNLKYVSTSDTGNTNQGISSGNFYAEVYVNSTSNSFIGVCDISNGLNPNRGGSFSSHGGIAYKENGDQYSLPVGGSSSTASYGASYTTGDIIGIAVDIDSDTVTFYKNGVSQGNTTNGVSHISSDGVYGVLLYGSSSTFTVNFGQDPSFAGGLTGGDIGTETPSQGAGVFKYSVPSGYLALCTANISDDDLPISPAQTTQADDYFNTVTYSGTSAEQSVPVGFEPDFTWIKNRTTTASSSLHDSVRGAKERLFSDQNYAESTYSAGTGFESFDSDPAGFTVNVGLAVGTTGNDYVAWNWKAGGTAVSNTDGTIASSVSANTDAGFSIVSYTGTGGTATVGHGLGAIPKLIISKTRNVVNSWTVYAEPVGNDKRLILNSTNAAGTDAAWGNTTPTSSVITLGSADTNGSGNTYIAYCFASVEGYSKFGSYTGNGSTDGTFVYTGFRPAWIMCRITSSGQWLMKDSVRSPENTVDERLRANLSNAENTGAEVDFTSNGFKARSASNEVNESGSTYIYMAFAEVPFKYSTGR